MRTITLTPIEAQWVSLGMGVPAGVNSAFQELTLTDQEADGLLRLTEKMLTDHITQADQAHRAAWQALRDRLADAEWTPDPETPP